MAKGSAHPAGVKCYGYKKSDSRGKAHPDSVNAGQAQVEFYEGSQPAVTLAKGGSAKIAGVKQAKGTEPLGAKVRHLNASHSGPAKVGADASARPDGVRVFRDNAV